MSSPEVFIRKFYAEFQPKTEKATGTPKNRRMNGIMVKHRKKDAIVYFYIKGMGSLEFGPKFKNNIRRIFETGVLHNELLHCDFAKTGYNLEVLLALSV